MSSVFDFDTDTGCLRIQGELTIHRACEAVDSLRAAVATGVLRMVDLGNVTEVDTAGLQWLLLVRRLLGPGEQPIEMRNHSQPVLEALQLSGLESLS